MRKLAVSQIDNTVIQPSTVSKTQSSKAELYVKQRSNEKPPAHVELKPQQSGKYLQSIF